MKKIKYFIVAIISILCFCMTFTGCAASPYIENSFDYTATQTLNVGTPYSTLKYTFQIYIEEPGDYELFYELYVTDLNNNHIETSPQQQIIMSNANVYSISKTIKIYTPKQIKVTLQNVKMYPVSDSSEKKNSEAYAIGFGVTGAVILGGLIALFVCDKKGLLKKKDK